MISVSGYSERDGWADIGWSISSLYQNRGFAAEAAGVVMRFLFDGVGFARLQAVCAVDNLPSIRVMEKLGMAREGTLRRYFVDAAGAAHDCYLYALLSSDREKSSRQG